MVKLTLKWCFTDYIKQKSLVTLKKIVDFYVLYICVFLTKYCYTTFRATSENHNQNNWKLNAIIIVFMWKTYVCYHEWIVGVTLILFIIILIYRCSFIHVIRLVDLYLWSSKYTETFIYIFPSVWYSRNSS